MRQSARDALPPISKRHLAWFHRYVRFYLRRHFHGLHLLRLSDLRAVQDYPILVCLNHPSWWDPLIALHLSQRFFEGRQQYAPISAAGIAKYRFFERLGLFGIETGALSGAKQFMHVGEAVLQLRHAALWITPQGAFTDVRRRPVTIEPGAGHLAHRAKRLAMLPLALEYSFWQERFPEAFACFGQPVLIENGRAQSPREWSRMFAAALEETQEILAARVQRREAAAFESLLAGDAGVGGVYDLWRASKARLQGKRWHAEHGSR